MYFFVLVFIVLLVVVPVIVIPLRKNENETGFLNLSFPPILTVPQKDFEAIVKQEAVKYKRISNLTICGYKITGKVISQSKFSDWLFEIDFNDHGKLTGEFSEKSENADSNIPLFLGVGISKSLKDYPKSMPDRNAWYAFCPHCGHRLPLVVGEFCTFCGERFITPPAK